MSKEIKSRVAHAFRTMKGIGFGEDRVRPVLKELLKQNHKNWGPIEENEYRALVYGIIKKETQDHLEEEVEQAEESQPPLKRVKQEYPDGHTPALTVPEAFATRLGSGPSISSTPLPTVSSSQEPLDSILMSLRKEFSGLDMVANEAAASEGHIAQALSHFASGVTSLVCAGEELKSNQATVTKLQAEATTLGFELAEANKAKTTVVENLKIAQRNYQMLVEELEDVKADREAIQATLGKTREELKSSHATISKLQVEACTFNFEMAEANKAKAVVAENLKTAQDSYHMLLEELEDVKADREAIQATLGKTREELKSSHATVSKLQAEATALKFEVVDANKAKANFQTLCEELEDVKADREAIRATLGKTRDGLHSSHATVKKLQAEATAFRYEAAKANDAKSIVFDNLKTAQSKFSTLLEEINSVKADREATWATLSKTRAQLASLQEKSESEASELRSKLQAREQELVASKKELEATKEELDAAKKGDCGAS